MCETKTRDNVFVQITAAVQMQPNLRNVRDAIYKLNDPTQQVTSYVADVVRAEVPKMTLDQVFENKDAIALAVATKITEKMGKFGYNILQALVTNVEPANPARPPQDTPATAAHFGAHKTAAPAPESKALQGQGIAKQRAAIVDGLRESIGFSEGEGAAKQVSELLLVTQYFDTLEKISEGKSSTIFIPHSVGGVSDVASNIRNGILQANPPGQGGYGFN
jgi:regulator of protease activity HflC (stomatin/prohibitin superfamily)